MKLKILSVDFDFENENVDNNSFFDKLSFSDYDAVIIDPKNILHKLFNSISHESDGTYWLYSHYDEGVSKLLGELMEKRKEEAKLVTQRNQGIVVCFLRSVGEELNCARNKYDKSHAYSINRYDWIPALNDKYGRNYQIYNYIKDRNGKEIGKIYETHPFADYIKNFKDKIRYEAVLSESIFSDYEGISSILKPIALNKAKELIAFEIAFGNGKFIFLPPVEQPTNNKMFAGTLISCIKNMTNVPQLDAHPQWIVNYSLPGEDKLSAELKEIRNKEEEIAKERKNKKAEIDKLNLIKSLLYGSGKYLLEPAVREAFRIIGFNVLDPDTYSEEYDLLAKEDDLLIIGEIGGSEKQINIRKYRQLFDYVNKTITDGKKCKGLLIGNGFLNEDPARREEQFTEKAIRGCKSQQFCRITTFELFKAVAKVLSSPDDLELKENIKKAILNCNDEFKFSLSSAK